MNRFFCALLLLMLCNGCTLPLLLGHLEFSDFDKTYTFNFSKETLKDKIVEQYSYDASTFSKLFGRTLIENNTVNKTYRVSTTEWLDRKSWDQHRHDIRQGLQDTTDILLVKHLSRKSIRLRIIIQGNNKTSSMSITSVTACRKRAFKKSHDFYRPKFTETIEAKFIEPLM